MNALIIDDHKINSLYLKTLLEKNCAAIKKIDEAGTIAAAKIFLETVNYDVIFLDIELKDGMGFDVLKEINDFVYVIVVTNHKEYAIQAIKHNVVDYLLKPIDVKEVKMALKKVIKLQDRVETTKNLGVSADQKSNEDDGAVMINFKNQFIALHMKDILFIKAIGKYSEIHVANKKHYTSYKNLKEFENRIAGKFVRLHHSYLVNTKCIVSYSRETCHVMLTNGVEIPVSVRKREVLFKKFNVF